MEHTTLTVFIAHRDYYLPNPPKNNDIVLTSYNYMTSTRPGQGSSFDKMWKRVVLDEAHEIRNEKTNVRWPSTCVHTWRPARVPPYQPCMYFNSDSLRACSCERSIAWCLQARRW